MWTKLRLADGRWQMADENEMAAAAPPVGRMEQPSAMGTLPSRVSWPARVPGSQCAGGPAGGACNMATWKPCSCSVEALVDSPCHNHVQTTPGWGGSRDMPHVTPVVYRRRAHFPTTGLMTRVGPLSLPLPASWQPIVSIRLSSHGPPTLTLDSGTYRPG